jgi:hypothetical protein
VIRWPFGLLKPAIRLYGKYREIPSRAGAKNGDALQTFFEGRDAEGYVAICPFFQLNTENIRVVRPLRDRMTEVLVLPVQISTGPRYRYALGKIYKHGPANGIFIILPAEPDEDIVIPGVAYTLGSCNWRLRQQSGARWRVCRSRLSGRTFSMGEKKV